MSPELFKVTKNKHTMNSQEVIKTIKEAVQYAKDQGLTAIQIENLHKYLKDLEQDTREATSQTQHHRQNSLVEAEYRASWESKLEHWKAINQSNLEQFKTVILAGQSAIKSAVLINGGASVALLAFIGKIWDKNQSANIANLSFSLMYFVFGVLLAAVASGTTYLCQETGLQGQKKLAYIFNGMSIALVVTSYILFGLGAYAAYFAFTQHKAT